MLTGNYMHIIIMPIIYKMGLWHPLEAPSFLKKERKEDGDRESEGKRREGDGERERGREREEREEVEGREGR